MKKDTKKKAFIVIGVVVCIFIILSFTTNQKDDAPIAETTVIESEATT